jgi:hypothetical protein
VLLLVEPLRARYPFFTEDNCDFLAKFVVDQFIKVCKEVEATNNTSVPIEQAKAHAEKALEGFRTIDVVMKGYVRSDFFTSLYNC